MISTLLIHDNRIGDIQMKKLLVGLSLLALSATASAGDFFGGSDGEWKMGPYGPYYEESDWPEWTPMYWMDEFMDEWDSDDDNFGGMPFMGGGYPMGGGMPYGGMPMGAPMGYGAQPMPMGAPAPMGYGPQPMPMGAPMPPMGGVPMGAMPGPGPMPTPAPIPMQAPAAPAAN